MHFSLALPLLRPLLLATCGAYACTALAQSTLPNAGNLLQQHPPAITPSARPANPARTAPEDATAPLGGQALEVRHLEITGNTLFSTDTLHALVQDAEGQRLTLSELGTVVRRITEYYRTEGYPLSRAVVPAQRFSDGVLQVLVVEARLGELRVDNRSSVSDALVHDILQPLQSGQPVERGLLDHTLLLLADVPGTTSTSTLSAGQAVGTSDLDVVLEPLPAFKGAVGLDGHGNRYTGKERLTATLQHTNAVLGYGDVFRSHLMTSGKGMDFARLEWESLFNGKGSVAGLAYAEARYAIGGGLAQLQANGRGESSSLWVHHPLLRAPNFNTTVRLQYDHKVLRDDMESSRIYTARRTDAWSLGVQGDAHDTLMAGGTNAWSLYRYQGLVGFDDAQALAIDSASARTQGSYAKVNFSASRTQQLSAQLSLYAAVGAQWASTNLDASEKMSLGGPHNLRAYDSGALSGDEAQFATLELRMGLGNSNDASWQLLLFTDVAQVQLNKSPWTTSANDARLRGNGIGLQWSTRDGWLAKAAVAERTGNPPSSVQGDASTRVWLEVAKTL